MHEGLREFDSLMINAITEAREGDYEVGEIVLGYLASFQEALVDKGFRREQIQPIMKKLSQRLYKLYITEVKGSDNNE